jgi:hypothetical protein
MTEPTRESTPPAAEPAVIPTPRVLRSGESAEPLPGEGRPSFWPLITKVVGYSLLSIVLGVGVAVVGDNKPESIGSALIGILFVVMVVGSSGVNGFWNPKN